MSSRGAAMLAAMAQTAEQPPYRGSFQRVVRLTEESRMWLLAPPGSCVAGHCHDVGVRRGPRLPQRARPCNRRRIGALEVQARVTGALSIAPEPQWESAIPWLAPEASVHGQALQGWAGD